jgi:peptidoglycan/LPS O-acetylase OafA/YrhL
MFTSIGFFDLLEGILYAGGAIFAALLFTLSFSAYKNTRLKNLLYAVIAFSLFVIFLIYEYIEHTYTFDSPFTDIIVPSIVLAILVFFFLAIINKSK